MPSHLCFSSCVVTFEGKMMKLEKCTLFVLQQQYWLRVFQGRKCTPFMYQSCVCSCQRTICVHSASTFFVCMANGGLLSGQRWIWGSLCP